VTTEVETIVNTRVIANILRGLAIDVETNPALGVRVVEALAAAHILDEHTEDLVTGEYPTVGDADPNASIAPGTLVAMQVARIDVMTLFRTGGEAQLRERLAKLDLAGLRHLILVQQLDPDKKTSKLRSTAKLIDFIVTVVAGQVQQELETSRSASWML
jgi:hypothetical protein